MIDLHETQRTLIRLLDSRPMGCASRFKLMDAMTSISAAIEAFAREDDPNHPHHGEEAA